MFLDFNEAVSFAPGLTVVGVALFLVASKSRGDWGLGGREENPARDFLAEGQVFARKGRCLLPVCSSYPTHRLASGCYHSIQQAIQDINLSQCWG
jgi:hypothetical protein